MSRHQKDPLRPLTADERKELARLSRWPSAPAAQVERARALLAIADGASYTAAAHQVGRRHNETISAWVSRFNREGLAAVRPGHGGGAWIRYGADAQQRILAEWARMPRREPDGSATWSLSLLQKALRKAPDGLPQVSTFTIWRTLHEAGLSWQKSRTWLDLRRKSGELFREGRGLRCQNQSNASPPSSVTRPCASPKQAGAPDARSPPILGSGCPRSGTGLTRGVTETLRSPRRIVRKTWPPS